MPKPLLLIIALTVILVVASLTIIYEAQKPREPSQSEIDTAINQARLVFRQRKIAGEDFSKGPCLTNALMPAWVLDIAHNPRQPIDDLAENMCPAYLEGRAKHFVELDPDGNLIRAR